MVDTQAGGLYGVVAQPLTQDYLAAQLPMFQLKVPTFSQPILQFATNSPVNMPIPPLYPGEVIKLQQNRVVCTDNFREPAVGAVYVSNFRVIFYGNSISDPESMDDFQDSSHKVFQIKKEVQASADRPASPTLTKLRFKPFKGEPSFKSFLTGGGGEQESPKESAPIAMPTSSGRPPGRVAKSRNGKTGVTKYNAVERPDLCPSYPSHVIVPSCMGDLDLIRGASLYKENRFPVLTWYNSSNGAALLRAGGTKEERGQFGTNLQTDEAMLQAISGCKLNNTGPPMTVHIFTEKPEYRLKERNAEQVKSFYYHNCKFNYDSNPPTFKNVRHSFNNLQSLLESKLPDEDYFLAMDSTQWLPRISDLLSTAFEVSQALKKDGDHVLVCYESGWDRTTQIVSLAEILIDPYYRTMDGFQVLVQKEWVWFGHPFRLRHSRIGKVKDDGPVFLQWTDCVWQIMQQCPSAFEFNEKLLIALVEHSYSGLFGTFMNNNEGDRKKIFSEKGYEHVSVSSHTISFWMWVNMVNAAERRFFNEGYDSSCYEDVLQPQWAVPCLKLWISHYCKYKPKECYMHVSPLQTQLEGLQKTLMDLEALHAEISPSVPSTEYEISRDDFQVASIQSTSSTARRNSNRPPAPPPKPSSVKQYKYESLEEFLTQEGHSIEICKQLILGQTTCQGSLYKLGAKRKNWLQRWFVLDFNFQYLAYFENQQAYSNKESPKGVIRLGEISRVFQDVKKRDHLVKHVFMVATPHRTYQMQAPSITSMYIWMALLELPSSDLKLGSS